MDSAEYVLCGWKGQLWPARVLSRPITPTHSKRRWSSFLEVQILPAGEKISVRSVLVRSLTKSEILTLDSLAAKGSQGSDSEGKTREYRRALKEALDILGKRTCLFQGGRAGHERASTVTSKVLKEQASSSPCQSLLLPGGHQEGQGLSQRSPGKQGRPGNVLMGSQNVPAVHGGKARAQASVGSLHLDVKGNVLGGTPVWPSHLAPEGNAGDTPGKRKLSTPKLGSMSAPASGENAHDRNEQQAASGPLRRVSVSPKSLNQRPECGGLEIQAIGAQKKTALSQNKDDSGPGTLRPDSKGASAACTPPIARLRRSLRIESKRKSHVLYPQWGGLPELEPQVHSKVTSTRFNRFKRRGASVQRDGQAASMASAQEPDTIEQGSLVWYKFQDLPYWPAVVKTFIKNDKMARVLLIDGNMQFEHRGIRVPLHKLKPLDCREKISLLKRASRVYNQGISWCFSMIKHYSEEFACGFFLGTFMDYYTSKVSYPLRRAIQEGELHVDFPKVSYADLEDWEEEEEESALGGKRTCKRLLPDRAKAAWDRANQKLVDFIIKRKGADQHLLEIVKGRKESKWLHDLFKSKAQRFCVETYLEDEDQLHLVGRHLQEIAKEADEALLALSRGDKVWFTMEVLLPEAIIYSLAALEELSCEEAEEKYLQGPPMHYREKELFDKTILKAAHKR